VANVLLVAIADLVLVVEGIVGGVLVLAVVELKCFMRLAVSAVMIAKCLLNRPVVARFCVANVLINKVVVLIVPAVLAVIDVIVPIVRANLLDRVLKTKQCFPLSVIVVERTAKFLLDQVLVSLFIVITVFLKIVVKAVPRLVKMAVS